MSSISQSLVKTFQSHWSNLVPQSKGKTFAIAVSGGADSVALLHLLQQLSIKNGFNLHVLHINHGLRKESAKEEFFVKALANQLNIPISVSKLSATTHKSEEALRDRRYQVLFKEGKRLKSNAIILAHHQDDLAETVLMRLIRGTGLWGMQGIWPIREIEGNTLLRPLLFATKAEIKQWLRASKFTWCEDKSNQKNIYTRNKVRNHLIPLLAKEYNPSIVNTLADLAKTAGEDYHYLAKQAEVLKKSAVIQQKGGFIIDKKKWLQAPMALTRLLWRELIIDLTPQQEMISFDCIQMLENVMNQPKAFYQSRLWQVTIDSKKCYLSRR